MVEVTEKPDDAASEAADELKELLHAQLDRAKQEELVRVDAAPVHRLVGGALDLLADHFGRLEDRCATLAKDAAAQKEALDSRAAPASAGVDPEALEALIAERVKEEVEKALANWQPEPVPEVEPEEVYRTIDVRPPRPGLHGAFAGATSRRRPGARRGCSDGRPKIDGR